MNKHSKNPCLKFLFERAKERLKFISERLDDTINLSECIIEEKSQQIEKESASPLKTEQQEIQLKTSQNTNLNDNNDEAKSHTGLSDLSCSNIIKDNNHNVVNTSGNFSFHINNNNK